MHAAGGDPNACRVILDLVLEMANAPALTCTRWAARGAEPGPGGRDNGTNGVRKTGPGRAVGAVKRYQAGKSGKGGNGHNLTNITRMSY